MKNTGALKEFICPKCGTVFHRYQSNIKTENPCCSKKCGNSLSNKEINDFIGTHFGRLEVIEFSHRDKHARSLFRCKCECGNSINVAKCHLERKPGTVSCGCLSRQQAKTLSLPSVRETAVHTIYQSYTPNKNNRSTRIKNVSKTKNDTYRVSFVAERRRITIGTYKTLAEAKFIADSCRYKISEIIKELKHRTKEDIINSLIK